MKRLSWLLLAGALLAFPPFVRAQVKSDPDSLRSIRPALNASTPDTLRGGLTSRTVPEAGSDTTVEHLRPTKSPGTAMLLSALLPGAGQAYNASYWKVPVVMGFGLYFVSEFLTWNRHYKDYRDQYSAALIADPNNAAFILARRDVSSDNRDGFAWYFLILYVVNLVDAYVDASLFDFNVGSDLSSRSLPSWTPGPDGIHVQLRVHF